MTKEEKIQETYLELIGEENYNFLKNQINENGVCKIMDEHHNFITPKTTLMDLGFKRDDEKITSWIDSDGGYFVPKSLQGIENNNGWIKIESEDDLPENLKMCRFIPCNSFKERFVGFIDKKIGEVFFVDHYYESQPEGRKTKIYLNSWLTSQITHYKLIEDSQPIY